MTYQWHLAMDNRKHFGRTVLVMCFFQALITSSILRIGVGADEELLTHE
jgi:hypothetical protein